jgi:hypothetical protein
MRVIYFDPHRKMKNRAKARLRENLVIFIMQAVIAIMILIKTMPAE